MPIFGTSKQDEEALRAAAQQSHIQESGSRYSLKTTSSAYETASEFTNEDHSQADVQSHSDRYSSAVVRDHEEYAVDDERRSTQGTAIHTEEEEESKINHYEASDYPQNGNVDYTSMTENELNRIATQSETLSHLEERTL
ncbi:hypothetical protein ACNR90_000589 [Candidozyma auris]